MRAQTLAAPANVVNLSASASVEVQKDWLTVVFSTSRDGVDPASVQAQLKQALEAALGEARKLARPGQVDVQTGAFSLVPRYGPAVSRAGSAIRGGIVGWEGRAELLVQGRDVQSIAQLAGRINGMTIGQVGYSLSREARDKAVAEITAQAIDRFKASADAVSRQFGLSGYVLREVTVNSDGNDNPPQPMLRMQMSAAPGMSEALPTEAGRATVTVVVSGSVQMR